MTDANSIEDRKELLEWGHGYLLKIAQERFPGFKDDEGMCEGINSVLGHAVLLGEKAEQHFYDRLEFLRQFALKGNAPEQLITEINEIYQSNIISPETLKRIEKENAEKFNEKISVAKSEGNIKEQKKLEKEKLDDLEARKKEIREANQSLLSKEKIELQKKIVEFEVDAFFNTIVRAHNTPGLGLVDQNTPQYDKRWEHLSPLAFDDENRNSKYVHSNFIGTIAANSQELIEYFIELESILREKTKINPQGERPFFLLSCDNHTLSVYFDITVGKLRFFDVNNLKKHNKDKYFYASSEEGEGVIAHNVMIGLQDFDKGFEKSQTIFTIRRLSTQGYDLALMEDIGANLELDKNTSEKLPPKGKLFLSEKGDYIFRDTNNKVHKGVLNSKLKIDLHNLKSKLFDAEFKKAILESISKDTGVALIDNLDKILQTQANKSLYKKRLNPLSKKHYKEAINARGDNLLYFAITTGQITLAMDLISQKHKINEPNSEGVTPLMFAFKNNYIPVVKALMMKILNEAKTEQDKKSIQFDFLEKSLDFENLEIIQYLIENATSTQKPHFIEHSVERLINNCSIEFLEKFIDYMQQKNEPLFSLNMVQQKLDDAFLLSENKKQSINGLLEKKLNKIPVTHSIEKQKSITFHFKGEPSSSPSIQESSITHQSKKKKPE